MHKWIFSIVFVLLLLPGEAYAMCQGVPSGYEQKDDGWYYGRKIEGIDQVTFHLISGEDSTIGDIPCVRVTSEYAADNLNVYISGHILPGADPVTFSIVARGYTRDANHVYLRGRVINGADPKSFGRVEQTEFFKDSTHVYIQGQIVKDADASTFSSFSFNDDLARVLGHDAKHVFYKASEVPGANPNNVKVVGRQYWVSNQTMFSGDKPIGSADPTTFKTGGNEELPYTSEDKNNYYWNNQVYSKTECRDVGPIVLACKNYIIVKGYQYSQIDTTSLQYLGKLSDNGCGGVPVRSRIYQNNTGLYAVDGNGGVRKLNFIADKKFDKLDNELERRLCGGFPNPETLKPDFYPR